MSRRTWKTLALGFLNALVVVSCSGSGTSVTGSPDGGNTSTVDSGGSRDSAQADARDAGPSCGAGGTLCALGQPCKSGADCTSETCQAGSCVAASCTDGVLDGTETGVDCGGSACTACGPGETCKVAADCLSDVCTAGVCEAPSATDGVKNDSETDIDCGGGLLASGQANTASDGAPVCAVGKGCLLGSDCAEGVCATGAVLVDNLDGGTDGATTSGDGGSGALACQPATPHDGVKNDSETDVDCGGALLASGASNSASDGAPACAAGKACALASDCESGVCDAHVCSAPTASDLLKNDSETDVDCGGGLLADGTKNPSSDGAPACADGKTCVLGSDCVDLVCADGPVTTPSADGSPINCPAGTSCTCQPPLPTDGVRNDSETDVDCGGALLVTGATNPASDKAPVCTYANHEHCVLGLDCDSLVCNDNAGAGGPPADCPTGDTCECQPPSSTDGVKNGGETDVDCGGGTSLGSDGAPGCAVGKDCKVGSDCASVVCSATSHTCVAPTSSDGVQNGGETDVDCGGTPAAPPACVKSNSVDCAPPCADARKCGDGTDCLSAYCSTLTNRCVDGQSCAGLIPPASILDISVEASSAVGGADAIGVPNVNGTGQHAGLDTCGAGESTDPPSAQTHESCCKSLPVPGLASCSSTTPCPTGETCSSTTAAAGTCQVRMDKYEATTGRMRQFIESVKKAEGGVYNLQAWVKAQISINGTTVTALTPAGAELLQMIPVTGATSVLGLYPTSDTGVATYLSIVAQLGGTTIDEGYPSDAQGCFTDVQGFGAGTYWFDAKELEDVVGSPPRPFTQDYYDIKPQNCTPYWVAAAFCAWDGGRLPNAAETLAVYGTGQYPFVAGTTVPPVLFNTATDTTPLGELAIQANHAGYAITNYTVDWHNSNLGSSTGQGDFYYYPSYADSNPSSGPLGMDAIIDTLSAGLDLTPYIAAPGRFTPDLTTVKSADGEGWMDYGANMMEWGLSPAQTTGPYVFCDTTSPTVTYTPAQIAAGATCPVGGCARTQTKGGDTDCGITRSASVPAGPWEGGSWEGHAIQLTRSLPFQTQYGKNGIRCVRPVEPAP